MTQWPVFGRAMAFAFEATIFTCWPNASPFAFSPPIESTGIVSFVLGKLREILGGLLKGYEVSPRSTHPSGAGVRGGVCLTICIWNRPCFISGEVVPEMLEVGPLPASDERLRRRRH